MIRRKKEGKRGRENQRKTEIDKDYKESWLVFLGSGVLIA